MHHLLEALFPISIDTWVHSSWGARLFPDNPPDRSILSEMVDDPEVCRHLIALDVQSGIPAELLDHTRSEMTTEAGFALQLLGSSPETLLSLLGHCASAAGIRKSVMGKVGECPFNPEQSRLALEVAHDIPPPRSLETAALPFEFGRQLFESWLVTCSDVDLCFLRLAMEAETSLAHAVQANEVVRDHAEFVKAILLGLSTLGEPKDA